MLTMRKEDVERSVHINKKWLRIELSFFTGSNKITFNFTGGKEEEERTRAK